jgi:hypothetical protein
VCFGGKVVSWLGLNVFVGFELGDQRKLIVAGYGHGYGLVLFVGERGQCWLSGGKVCCYMVMGFQLRVSERGLDNKKATLLFGGFLVSIIAIHLSVSACTPNKVDIPMICCCRRYRKCRFCLVRQIQSI